MAQRPEIPRTVKPRKRTTKNLGIIAIDGDNVYLERTGEIYPLSELPALVILEDSSIVVAHNVGQTLKMLDDKFTGHPRWQFRVSPVKRELWRPNREPARSHIRFTVCAFFGLQGTKKVAGKYHYPIDPMIFVDKTAHGIIGGNEPTVMKLYRWAADVRQWCSDNGLDIKPTSGGIAGQLLKDSRFYPEARRKVPKVTNERAREQLPGNYYRLITKPNKFFDATYLDQTSAHHYAAQNCHLPHSDRLRAKGYFRTLTDKPWLRSGSAGFSRVTREQYGLLYVRLSVPHLPRDSFPLPCMEKQGSHLTYIYTNEIPDIEALGGRIEYIIAAWTSTKRDTGIRDYSLWAQSELRQTGAERREWLKPTLLSTYGILAAKPKPLEFGFKRAKSGEVKHYPIGGARLKVIAKSTERDIEMPTANVIQRAMIEAHTRLVSIRMARMCHKHKLNVLAIYADSVIVESGPLPLLSEPWKIQAHLSNLRFINPTSFTSTELTKLPGIHTKDEQERALRAKQLIERAQAAKGFSVRSTC